MIHPSAFIHPKAHVEGATVGAGCKVWQFASVIRGAVLGEGCNVASCATLDGPRLGARCIVSPGVDIGPGFWIGDDVFLGPNVVLCNDAWPRVAKDGFDVSRFGFDTYSVIVGSGASIGANVVILPGVVIGARAMIAAGSRVTRNVAPGHLWTDAKFGPIANEGARMADRMRFAGAARSR